MFKVTRLIYNECYPTFRLHSTCIEGRKHFFKAIYINYIFRTKKLHVYILFTDDFSSINCR